MINTIQQYAKKRDITVSGVAQLKSITIEKLPLYARIGDTYHAVTDKNGEPFTQKFVIEK